MNYRKGKRVMDVSLALVLLVVLSPVFFAVMFAINLEEQGTIFFRQQRAGQNGQLFTIYKFRTMLPGAPNVATNELTDSQHYITRIGRFLRQTSLDELPQLLNVLKGDMALIGPRPLLVKYLPLYTPTQMRRHEVRPGITGWAQVNGRNTITHTKKFEYDVWYVDHISFALDIKIILMTIKNVLHHKDISTEGQATAPTFDGTN